MNPPAPVMLIFSFFSGQYAAEPCQSEPRGAPRPPPGPLGRGNARSKGYWASWETCSLV